VPVRLLPAAVCALGAHALLYRTFRPGDGVHGYFGWYEPLLAGASLVALLLVRPSRLRTRQPIADTTRRVSTAALFVLLAQETLERSLQSGHVAFAALTPSQWLVLLCGIVATAVTLACALRAGQVMLTVLLRDHTVPRLDNRARWSVVIAALRPARPLASGFALRAPPLLVQ
jgi:hypothetical protein